MPKVQLATVGQEKLKTTLADIGASRQEIANQCGVGIEALKKWIANGKLPQTAWDKLEKLRKDAVQAKMAELFPIESAAHVMKLGEDPLDAAKRIAQEKQVLMAPAASQASALPSALANVSTDDLLKELVRRRYYFVVKRDTPKHTAKRKKR